MKEIEQEIGIYTDIYPTGKNDKYGQRICHAKCKICETVVYKPINRIRSHHSVCNHIDSTTKPDIGIYTNIHESGNKANSGHKLYYAICSVCSTVVEKTWSDIKESNKICRHKVLDESIDGYKINDMPKGWMNESALNMRIYYLWKAMITRTTQKYWDKYPTYTGTTVDNSWRKLSQFVNDIQELPGYDQWEASTNRRIMLDKDTIIAGNKCYSKETCCFLTHAESNQDVAKRHPENLQKARQVYIDNNSMPVILININTEESIKYPSIKAASRNTGLNYKQVRKAFHSNDPNEHIVKGWLVQNPAKTIQN